MPAAAPVVPAPAGAGDPFAPNNVPAPAPAGVAGAAVEDPFGVLNAAPAVGVAPVPRPAPDANGGGRPAAPAGGGLAAPAAVPVSAARARANARAINVRAAIAQAVAVPGGAIPGAPAVVPAPARALQAAVPRGHQRGMADVVNQLLAQHIERRNTSGEVKIDSTGGGNTYKISLPESQGLILGGAAVPAAALKAVVTAKIENNSATITCLGVLTQEQKIAGILEALKLFEAAHPNTPINITSVDPQNVEATAAAFAQFLAVQPGQPAKSISSIAGGDLARNLLTAINSKLPVEQCLTQDIVDKPIDAGAGAADVAGPRPFQQHANAALHGAAPDPAPAAAA